MERTNICRRLSAEWYNLSEKVVSCDRVLKMSNLFDSTVVITVTDDWLKVKIFRLLPNKGNLDAVSFMSSVYYWYGRDI